MSSKQFIQIFNKGKKAMQSWNPLTFKNVGGQIDVLDFFCCAGGMSLGFASLCDYYHILGGIELNPISMAAYYANYHTKMLNADISEITPDAQLIREKFDIDENRQNPLVIIGCAPCQGFSAHRKKDHGNPEDERNTLIGYFSDIAVSLNPDYVVMENVPGILDGKYRNHYDEAKMVFVQHGYHVTQQIYNSASFGVPQARRRAIIVASKDPNFKLPVALLTEDEYKTVRDAIGDLPPIDVRHQNPIDPLHRCSSHKQSTIDVISQVPHNGGSRPQGIGPKCLDKVKGFSDVYGRLSWDKPSITITQYARNPASGRYCHPEQDRGLSIREAARLQSFPDGYLWNGSLGDKFKQIGEAVPPLLSLAIATQIALTINQEQK